jgi:STE24 endopeptidase
MLDTVFLNLLAAKCAYVEIPKPSPEVIRYYNSGNVLWMIQVMLSFIIPILFLFTGFSGNLSKFSQTFGRKWFFSLSIYLIIFITIYQFLEFPFDFYTSYLRQHAYGLSNQTFSRWFSNYGKKIILTMVGGIAFVWIFYLLLKRSPKRWWFYSSLLSVGISFILMFIKPIWIDPLFNQFGAMKDRALEKEILTLAFKGGIEGSRVYEVDKSVDTKTANAYVTGFGSTKRIVFYDTMTRNFSSEEILFVTAHEMGHYVLHHLWWMLLYLAVLSFVVFYFIYRSGNYLLMKYQRQFGFSELSNIASFPLVILLLTLFMFVCSPLSNYISRYMEHEADRFGLELVQDNKAAGETFVKLAKEGLVNPVPGNIYKIWRCSHPPIGERVEFCNSYCPWKKKNQSLEYEKYLKDSR